MTPRPTSLVPSVLVACLALASPLGAQWGPHDRPRPASPLSSLLSEHARLHVAPAVGLVAGHSAHSGLDARVTWERASAAGWSPQLALTFGGARNRAERYVRSGLGGTLRFERPGLGAWLRASAGVGSGDGPAQAFTFEAGGRAGILRLDVRTTWLRDDPAIDSMPGGLPGSVTLSDDRYTDAELSGTRALGPLRAQARLGARFGRDPRAAATRPAVRDVDQWVNATLSLPLRGRASLELSGGLQPERPELMQHGGAFAQLGLRIDVGRAEATAELPPAPPAAAALTAAPTTTGSYRLRLRIDAREVVELKGDLTDWQPVPMQRAARDSGFWEVVIAASPGLYHVNLRIDGGEWIVPPGLATVPDGFGGDAGLLALR